MLSNTAYTVQHQVLPYPVTTQYSHTLILQCTLSNGKCQESGQTGLSNPFYNTYEECRLWASSVMNEPTKQFYWKNLDILTLGTSYQFKTANVHIQQQLTTQAQNISNKFSVAIEPIEFSWVVIENILRSFFPVLVEQLKLPDKNSSNDIFPIPAPASVNNCHPFTPTQPYSNNNGRSLQSKGHVQSPINGHIRSAAPKL